MIGYDKDFYGWTQEQAKLLREGLLSQLDIENLIEEIETMGRSEKRELQSRLTVLLVHLLKWQYQPIRRGKSWQLTIKGQRIKLDLVIKDNPGLKPHLPDIITDAYKLACVDASRETSIDDAIFPVKCPWTFQQLTDNTYYPE